MKIIFGCILIISCSCLNAKNKIVGKIVDRVTGESMPFVSIFVTTNSHKSTISNASGDFAVNDLLESDTVVFSYVGYEELTISGQNLSNNSLIHLAPGLIELPEIVVTNINIKNLLRESFDRIKMNYPSDYPILKGIYRKQINENSACVFIGESDLVIKPVDLKGLVKGKRSEVFFSDIKVSANSQSDTAINFNFINAPLIYPAFSEIRPEYFDDYDWRILDIYDTKSNDRILKIVFNGKISPKDSLKKYNSGIIFVSEKDKAILAARIIRKMNDISTSDEGTAIDNYLIMDAYYKKNGAQYLYSYMRSEWKFKYISKDRKSMYDYSIIADYLTKSQSIQSKYRFRKAIFDPFKAPKDVKILPYYELNSITPDYDFKYQ